MLRAVKRLHTALLLPCSSVECVSDGWACVVAAQALLVLTCRTL